MKRYEVQEVPGGWTVLDLSKNPPESIVGVDTKSSAEFMSRIINFQNEEHAKLKERYEELEKNYNGLRYAYNEQSQEFSNKLRQAEEFANKATEISSSLLTKIMEALGWDYPKLPFPDSIIEEISKLRQEFEQTSRIAKAILNDKKNEN